MDLGVGTIIDRYCVEGVIGRGGMAVVYQVRHMQLGTVHALKVLTLNSAGIRYRLLQEGQIQARLDHPNIVAVRDVLDVGGAPGLLMEIVSGPSLDQLLESGPLSLAQADVLARGVLEGVAAAHARGVLHRDLKPGNVLIALTAQGPVPKVTDFGLAKVLRAASGANVAGNTRSGAIMGTPSYMSPEQIQDASSVDERTDVFALGALLYEIVTGRQAFPGENTMLVFQAISAGQFTPPRALVPNLPDRMERAMLGALQPDPARRFASAQEMLAAWLDMRELPSRVVSGDGPWTTAEMARVAALRAAGPPSIEQAPAKPQSPALIVTQPDPIVEVDEPDEPSPMFLYVVGAVAGLLALSLVGVGLSMVQWGEPAAEPPPPPQVAVAPRPTPAPPRPPVAPPPPPAPELPEGVALIGSRVSPESVAPVSRGMARVIVDGDVEVVRLVGPEGTFWPGEVPPGTYVVEASFTANQATKAGAITVEERAVVSVRCAKADKLCE
jgi:serine/threonine-protein kinase